MRSAVTFIRSEMVMLFLLVIIFIFEIFRCSFHSFRQLLYESGNVLEFIVNVEI